MHSMEPDSTDVSSHGTVVHPSSPPPPPPLPPPPLPPPPTRAPADVHYHPTPRQSVMAAKFAAYEKAREARKHDTELVSSANFSPCHLFFYGSLMDPDVLQTVLGLTHPPRVEEAKVLKFSTKMWGIYPALVPCEREDAEVRGVACKIGDFDHFLRLCAYETIAYRPCFCTVVLDDGTVLKGSRTFVWAGDADSEELEDGQFDLERYRKRFKRSLVRERARD